MKKDVEVMIAGLSSEEGKGKMAKLIAEGLMYEKGFFINQKALALEDCSVEIRKNWIDLYSPEKHVDVIKTVEPDVIVDFTAAEAVKRNSEMYCDCETPFIMGTTSGDEEGMRDAVIKSNISGVYAPNIDPKIAVLMAMFKWGSKFRVFEGCSIETNESHQPSKQKESGTGRNILENLKKMGCKPVLTDEGKEIYSERNPDTQKRIWRIPGEHINGHAYHNYKISSLRGDADIFFGHNVRGREGYIDGVMKAIIFLISTKEKGRLFSMEDVLSS